MPNAATDPAPPDNAALDALVERVGGVWSERLAAIAARCNASRSGRAVQQRHIIELTIDRLRRRPNRPPSVAEQRIAALAATLAAEIDRLTPPGRARLQVQLDAALTGQGSLMPLFHLAGSIARQRGRRFTVDPVGLEEGAPFDLLLSRDGVEAELVCDVISAEDGRGVHRGAWYSLADRIDPDLQTWLAAHPGRYLLKMTLPNGLDASDARALGRLHEQITAMLADRRRADQNEAAVLRLDPLTLAAAQADQLGLVPQLRRQFGPEAHLSVTAAGEALFVMAARAGQENDVAAAVHRRMAALAPTRLTGTRPGILAMFVADTDRTEWRALRESWRLEREARQFLTCPQARAVVAVTCMSRLEMFGEADGAAEGELRFCNPLHASARAPGLAASVSSCT